MWSRILIRFEIEILLVKPMSVNKKSLFLRRNFSIHFRPCHAIDFARDKEDEILNRLLRMILRINPVRYWNFVSQTDVNEQEKPVFTS